MRSSAAAVAVRLATCSAIAATSATPRSVPVSRSTAAECTVSQKLQRLVIDTATCIASLASDGSTPCIR